MCLLPALAGCHSDSPKVDPAGAVVTVRSAVRALVAGRAAKACGYLTSHGRTRALEFRVDFDREGTIPWSSPRVPQNCEQIAARERRFALQPQLDYNWLDAARHARFKVVRASAETAVVRISGGGLSTTVSLRKTGAGWRVDDSPRVPSGH